MCGALFRVDAPFKQQPRRAGEEDGEGNEQQQGHLPARGRVPSRIAQIVVRRSRDGAGRHREILKRLAGQGHQR